MGVRVRGSVAWAIGVVAALVARAPAVEAAPPMTEAAWQMLYDSAIALLDSGEPAPACPMLEDAARFRAGAGVLLALGRCYAAAGKPSLALDRYQQALAAAPQARQDPAGKERLAREGIAAMDTRVARIAVTLPAAAPAGTTVTKDGQRIALGTVMVVDPGTYDLEVSVPGREPARVRVVVAPGERAAPRFLPGDAGPPSAPEAGPAAPAPVAVALPLALAPAAPPRSLVLPGLALGTGVVGLTMMGVGGGLLLSKRSVIEAECDAQKHCSQVGYDAASSGRTLSAVGTVGAVVGVAGLAGLVTWLVWPRRDAAPAAARATPMLAPGYRGVAFGATF